MGDNGHGGRMVVGDFNGVECMIMYHYIISISHYFFRLPYYAYKLFLGHRNMDASRATY